MFADKPVKDCTSSIEKVFEVSVVDARDLNDEEQLVEIQATVDVRINVTAPSAALGSEHWVATMLSALMMFVPAVVVAAGLVVAFSAALLAQVVVVHGSEHDAVFVMPVSCANYAC